MDDDLKKAAAVLEKQSDDDDLKEVVAHLEEMGLGSTDVLLELLKSNGGSVQRALEVLFNEAQ